MTLPRSIDLETIALSFDDARSHSSFLLQPPLLRHDGALLLELHGNLAAGGYGHGLVRVWSEDGTYLAVGSQTASMIYIFDA